MQVGLLNVGDGYTTGDVGTTYAPCKPSNCFSRADHQIMKLLSCIDNCTPCLLDFDIRVRHGEVSGGVCIERQVGFSFRLEEFVNFLCVARDDFGQFNDP